MPLHIRLEDFSLATASKDTLMGSIIQVICQVCIKRSTCITRSVGHFLRVSVFIWAQLNGLARFSRSRLTSKWSKFFVKFSTCLYERADCQGSVQTGISVVRGLEILFYEHFSQVTGMKAGWILANRMTSSCIACYIFHIISIPTAVIQL